MTDSIKYYTKPETNKQIIDESRYRPLVPFIGSGISFSAGYPTIRLVTQYLAKVKFAIHLGVFRDRFPVVRGGKESLVREYRQHPSKYIEDFGWPELGQLDADLWNWIKWLNGDVSIKVITMRDKEKIFETINNDEDNLLLDLLTKENLLRLLDEDSSIIDITERDKKKISEITNGKKKIDYRDFLNAIVQWTLRRELANQEEGTKDAVKDQWDKWKEWYSGLYDCDSQSSNNSEPKLLFGDWESLLDSLCEGNYDLVDSLFNQLEKGLTPSISHRLLAFLQLKLGIPLVLTTNFDSLLEQAFRGEGLKPAVFDIHKDADLPSSDLVRKQLSIIKLHGSAYGLRYGERLKQRLDIDAENSAKQYLPDNALVVVLGFSGSERRMMQMLQSFVHSHGNDTRQIKLIWIQGPGSPGPLVKELEEVGGKSVMFCKVRHADTFLQELYFDIANSHQSSKKHYTSLPGQLRMTEVELGIVGYVKNKRANHRKPVQCFLADMNTENPSGSWATLSGVAFTNSLDSSYKVIWIDMEHYQSVQGIISEFFYQVRKVNPKAPSCNISALNIENKGKGKGKGKKNKEIEKIVGRIREVFQRGRYVLVLDSLESFGRPPMDHHGIPTNELIDFKSEVAKLYDLIESLILNGKSDESFYWDSYVVLTIEKPRSRHPTYGENTDMPENLKTIYSRIRSLLRKTNSLDHVFWVHQNSKKKRENRSYDDFNEVLKAIEEKRVDNIPDVELFSEDWLYSCNRQRDINRAKHRTKSVLKLLNILTYDPSQLTANYSEKKQVISAFVTLLSFFRQPRTIPMLHSIIQRWVLREGESDSLEKKESHAIGVHKNINDLIKKMSPKIEVESDIPKVGVKSAIPKEEVESAFPKVAQKHEGGSVWLYREVHECTYNAQTEFLHRKFWITNEQYNIDDCVGAMLDGMIFVSWHLIIARTYYVDIFLPTKDIKSFYEYLYHRVTAIRTLSLLLYILDIIEKEKSSTLFINEIVSLYEEKEGEQGLLFSRLIKELGFLSQIPEYQISSYSEVSVPQENSGSKKSNVEKNILAVFKKEIKALYFNSIETLQSALKRNKLIFLAQSAPDTVDAWSNQFLKVDLPQMLGVDLCKNNNKEIVNSHLEMFSGMHRTFIQFFKEQKLYAGMARLNFKEAIDDYINVSSPIEKYIEESESKGFLSSKTNDIKKNFKTLEKEIKGIELSDSEFSIESFILKCIFYIKCLQCYLFVDCRLVYNLADVLYGKVCDVDEKIKDEEKIKDNEIALLVRDLISLKGKALIVKWPFWKPLLDREIPNGDEAVADLKNVEKISIAYEDTLRMVAKTIDEDAYHRSTAFSLRARSLYLQGHFSEAHHFLDIAPTGLSNDRVDHRVRASAVHLVRAELLSTSAEKKYDTCLKTRDSKCDEVDFKSRQLAALHTSLKKIKRANQELLQAERLLQDIAHENIWLIILEFGFAQLQLEKLLFRMELLEIDKKDMSDFLFLKENGALEQSILEGMQRLRNVLDLIPLDSRTWEELQSDSMKENKDQVKPNENSVDCYPMMVTVERMCYKLWKHLFVVGGYYSRLLNIQYHSGKTGKASTTYSVFGDKRYGERWLHWCHSMRFLRIGKSVLGFTSIYSNNTEVMNEEDYFVESSSLRALVIEIMKEDCNDKINQMWDARRS